MYFLLKMKICHYCHLTFTTPKTWHEKSFTSSNTPRCRDRITAEAITGFVGILTTLGGLVLLAVLLTTISDYFAKQVEVPVDVKHHCEMSREMSTTFSGCVGMGDGLTFRFLEKLDLGRCFGSYCFCQFPRTHSSLMV